MNDRTQRPQTWIDAIATPFDRAWRACVRQGCIGQRPRIEDSLAGLEGPRRSQLLEELLRIELHWRREAGEVPTSEEYQSRFPGHAPTIEGVFAKVAPAPPQPQDAVLSFFLGSRTPAAAALSTTSPQPGSLPFLNHEWGVERYAPIRRLGEGAFGVVYLAEDRELRRRVALKLPKRLRLASEQDAIDFLAEARNLAQLDHPGIVPVYDVGRAQDGRCYVVSKYIQGEDLRQRLKRRGRLEPQEAAELVRQVASALHHAHDQGLVHRDIKPANILLTWEELGSDSRLDASLANSRAGERYPDGGGKNQANFPAASTPRRSSPGEFIYEFVDNAGRSELGVVHATTLEDAREALDTERIPYNWVLARDSPSGRAILASAAGADEAGGLERDQAYVADFGLALKTEDVQLASQVAGTPAYMSPEQITGDVSQLDGRSDIFSLGVVFYELLVGERPFHGESRAELLKEIRSVTPKSPDRWHRDGYPDVPHKLGAICMKCLAKRPAARFQTGKQLADALDEWLTLEEPDHAAPGAPYAPLPRDSSAVLMALVLVLALAMIGYWCGPRLREWFVSIPHKIAPSPNDRTVTPTRKTFVR
jgi:serine/threonine protein kinase